MTLIVELLFISLLGQSFRRDPQVVRWSCSKNNHSERAWFLATKRSVSPIPTNLSGEVWGHLTPKTYQDLPFKKPSLSLPNSEDEMPTASWMSLASGKTSARFFLWMIRKGSQTQGLMAYIKVVVLTWAIKYAKMKIHLIDVHISCDVKGRLPQSNSCDGSRGRHGIVYHKPSWLGDQTIITALSEKWLISSLDITWATSKGRRLHKYGWFLGILQFFPNRSKWFKKHISICLTGILTMLTCLILGCSISAWKTTFCSATSGKKIKA